jgi:alkanesulfonate monooxygenase SsuD/methylene tetrahydromethanopterin reductase-like flavin-dependent oxidoreductase (luciferase family)
VPELTIGVGISTAVEPGVDPAAQAVHAERLGYDFVSASDHPAGDTASYEVLGLLTWAAARTERIGLATRVLGAPFRRPAMMAKQAESLHRLSGGRLILGLGGGASDFEIAAVGAAAHTPGQKVAGLIDTTVIARSAWARSDVSYSGRVHSVSGLTITPHPDAPIPIWFGTYGPRALDATGRYADGWIPSHGFFDRTQLQHALDRIDQARAAAERPAGAVRAVYNVPVRVDAHGRSSDGEITGTAHDVAEQLLDLVELGFTGFNLQPPVDQFELIATDVLPLLRAADSSTD